MLIHRGFGDLQLFGNFLVGKSFLPAQPEYLPPPGRQLIDGLLKQFTGLLVIELHHGRIGGQGGNFWDETARSIIRLPEQLAQAGDGPVTGNHMQPRLKIGYRGQFGAIEPDAEENILRDIFRLSGIFDISAYMREYLHPVLIKQAGKCCGIISSNADQQFPGII